MNKCRSSPSTAFELSPRADRVPYRVVLTEHCAKALGALPAEVQEGLVDLLLVVAGDPGRVGLPLLDERPDHRLFDIGGRGWVEYWIDELGHTVYLVHLEWLG